MKFHMYKFNLTVFKKALQFNLILLLIILSVQICFSADQIETTWWYNHYRNGFKFLNDNNLKSAETEFKKIINEDDTIAHGYYGLGLVYDKLRKDTVSAIDNLEKAIELNPDFIDAYYQLGLIYEHDGSGSSAKECFQIVIEKDPHHTDGWIALARAEEKFAMPWDAPIDPEPLEILAEALKYNPTDETIYEFFKEYAFWFSFETTSIPTFESMMKNDPSNSRYALDFARALYNLEDYESCLKLLDSIEIRYSEYSLFEINLMRSKILFNTEEIEKGLDYYWQAIDSLQTNIDSDLMFADLRYIMLDTEYNEYLSTSIKDLPSFYLRFWLSRDPNLATEVNERIAEHYKRLKYARNHFRRYESGYYNKVVIYEFEHPLSDFMKIKLGDELLNPNITIAAKDRKDLDDRGLIYLRHGEPDNFAFYNCMGCPLNLSWKYFFTVYRPEMIFHFSKHSDLRGWYLESLPYTFSQRGDFGGMYSLFDPTMSPPQDFLFNLPRYEELNEESIEHVKIGLHTETTDYEYEMNLIDFPLEYLCFKEEDLKTEVYLLYGISGDNLQVDDLSQKNSLSFSTFIGLYDEQWNKVLRHVDEQLLPIDLTVDEWEKSLIIELKQFTLNPGKYNFEFQIRDKMSDNLGVYKGKIYIPDYGGSELKLSDILLSGPLFHEKEKDSFKKDNISFNPHMFTAFTKDETVGLYVEVYNLLYDIYDRTKFEVTWSLREAEEDDPDSEILKSIIEYSGQSREDKIYFNLELSDMDSGEYELIISVKDQNSQAEAAKKVNLSIR